jgi:trehalose 6-phosphate phosphatase
MKKTVFSPEGRAALDRVMHARCPLLAFDFDGTLAPIVPRPDDARLPQSVVRRLIELSSRFETAIVSGRSLADLMSRLAFEPRHLVGNHGAEDLAGGGDAGAWSRWLDPVRATLGAARPQFDACGVTVEDKGPSIALHFRCAPDEAVARAAIDAALRSFGQELKVEHGKCVVNLVARGAPDKGDALRAIAERSHADAGLYVGDDENDEPAFAKLDTTWVTVRVGPTYADTRASFSLDGPSQMPMLLQYLIDTSRQARLRSGHRLTP